MRFPLSLIFQVARSMIFFYSFLLLFVLIFDVLLLDTTKAIKRVKNVTAVNANKKKERKKKGEKKK